MEFNIKSSTLNTEYEYKDTSIIVQGSFVKDAVSGNLQSISGSCYRNNAGQLGDYFGNFNGYPQGDDIAYDLSQMKRSDSTLVWNAIDDIESQVLPVDD